MPLRGKKGPQASYVADPALQMVLANSQADLGTARAQADERRKMLLLDYGDPKLAETFYGKDAGYIGSIGANPHSALKRLATGYGRTVRDADQAMNKQNLWYSGFRAKTLADLANDYQQQQYDLSQGTNRALMEINDFLLAAEREARDRKIAAEMEAFNRALSSQIPRG